MRIGYHEHSILLVDDDLELIQAFCSKGIQQVSLHLTQIWEENVSLYK